MGFSKMTRGIEMLFVALLSIGAVACGEKEPPISEPPAVPEAPAGAADNRGIFGAESCDSSTRVMVPANAVLALYFDKDGQPIGTTAEELTGTSNNTMCPLEEKGGPAGCPSGRCQITLPTGKTYCAPC